jgi:lipopolysaccharide export system protein LptC
MTLAPLPLHARDGHGAFSGLSRPLAPLDPRLARRRWVVSVGKRLLPVVALGLLASVALYPEFQRAAERARMALRQGMPLPQSGEMTQAVYHGVDERGRPYTMTSSTATQVSQERVNLTEPKGDVTLESGNWLFVKSQRGVFLQHIGSLDLSQAVQIYRDDGTTISTETATVDLKAGVAAGADQVHAEGPFGTLDAQGFAITDKGGTVQFFGPGKLVLNSARSQPPAPAPATANAPANP